ncbi:Hypothetical protein, putative [Bodo saltans]|uniref:CSD domain-containing protein n=1 Tax=Bodo saltans TaxID=75058 RepID=A0A0S4JKT9_BODSA|nr:Hypothetical protein, putative [Bodo saltans]|eukprot:CUG92151.1 Hypothetical protein, putative [Bodo saltans]
MCFGGGDIDSSCLQKLKNIVAACGGAELVTIVLSSTWRHDKTKIERLNKAFDGIGGIPHTSRGVPDGTKHTPTVVTYLKKDPQEQKLVRDRVDEIYEWMDEHKEEFPEAAIGGRWFAVDDMNLGVDPRMKDHFVKSDTEDGLQSSDVKNAEAMIAALPEYIVVAAAKPEAPPAAAVETAPAATPPSADDDTKSTFAPQAQQQQSSSAMNPSSAEFIRAKEASAASASTAAATAGPVSAMNPGEVLLYNVEYVGVVKRYNPNRGFGFLTAPNNEDVFVHQSMISHLGFRAVNVGENVCFQINDEEIPNPRRDEPGQPATVTRRQAIHIRQLSPYIPTNIQRQMMAQWELYQQPYVAAAQQPYQIVGSSQHSGKKSGKGNKQNNALQQKHVDPNNNNNAPSAAEAQQAPPAEQQTNGSAPQGTFQRSAPGSQYHGPGTRGRGAAFNIDLPLIPDGQGYRAVNGTVFYPSAAAVEAHQQQQQLAQVQQQQQHEYFRAVTGVPAGGEQQRREMKRSAKK